MKLYRIIVNFMVRRVMALGFIVNGTILALTSIPALLPGGTINFNGAPTDDIVIRAFAVLFPLVLAVLGVALYRTEPYAPK